MQVMVIVDSYLATAAVASGLLRDPSLARRWDDPSALDGFAVSGLAGHLAGNVSNVESFLDAPPLPEGQPTDVVRYYLDGSDPDTPVDDPIKLRIRSRASQRALIGPLALAEEFDAALSRLAPRLAGLDPSLNVPMFGRFVLPLDQCLIWGMLEFVVHIDDLSVSLDVPAPAIPEEAADLVVVALARIALGRRGLPPVLRALSRRERATDLATAF
jgi:mycothiol maleylpyruvate isomerase-like protein